jgi:beta-glucosidase/6-phospho-beta-glucosidase/beta-galactosidase
MYSHLGGFESTHIFGSGQDILGTTRHIEFWREDLSLLLESGIRTLRYSIPWHRIEQTPGEFDWTWIDGPMRWMQSVGLTPIVDPLHHTSFPTWLTDGFLNPEFPALYKRFVRHISDRYDWVTKFTIVNEPLPTTLFCSLTGMWYPHRASERDFVAMSLQVARCMCECSRELKRKNKQAEIVHVDTAEHHRATDQRSAAWAKHANARRFLMLDLVLGRVDRHHALYGYLTSHGATEHELAWFRDHPGCIDVLGLDYYIHSEMEWFWSHGKGRPDIHSFNRHPRGFAAVAEDYLDTYELPAMLTETNIRGAVHERIAWLKFMEAECEELLLAGRDLRGFCWYPSIDSTDWANACTACTEIVDPQGIWMLDAERVTRHPSELSRIYGALARGEITSEDIPVYAFDQELRGRLRGYLRLMDWELSSGDKIA